MHIERQDPAKAASRGVPLAAAVFAPGAGRQCPQSPSPAPLAPMPEAVSALPRPRSSDSRRWTACAP
jgi:hypothetical protein